MVFLTQNIANLITMIRIILSLVLISLIPESKEFLIVYTICGLTDVFDGFVARKLNIVSRFGSILDSASDLLFYTIMMIIFWKPLHIALSLYVWIGIWIVVGLRLFLYLYSAFHFKEFLSNHTLLNKVTGFLVFLTPYGFYYGFIELLGIIATLVSLIAVIYEFKLVGTRYETR